MDMVAHGPIEPTKDTILTLRRDTLGTRKDEWPIDFVQVGKRGERIRGHRNDRHGLVW